MTIEEYLDQVKKASSEIVILNRELENIKARKEQVEKLLSGSNYAISDEFQWLHKELLEEYKKARGNLLTAQNKAIELRHEIYSDISCLEDVKFQILEKRYFDNMPWDVIAEKMFMSLSSALKKHRTALDELEIHVTEKLRKRKV